MQNHKLGSVHVTVPHLLFEIDNQAVNLGVAQLREHSHKLRWLISAFVTLMLGLPDVSGQVFFLRDTFCTNQLFIVNGHLYGPDHPTGTEILPGAASNGADSIIEVRLVFLKPAVFRIEQIICGDDTLWVNNIPYHAGYTLGDETIEGGATNGCDSTIEVRLTAAVRPFVSITDTLCPDQFILVNGSRYDIDRPSGLEIMPNAAASGCDSIVQINLSIPDLSLTLGDDLEITIGDTVCLDPRLNFQPVKLEWSPTLPCDQMDCFPLCVPFFSSTFLELSATDPGGCVLRSGIQIKVNKQAPIYAPNVFNPEAAWPNNRFFLSAASGVNTFKTFRIADRWGELIWERENLPADSPDDGWDGQWKGGLAAPGVYVFWAEYELGDGVKQVVSGSFALLR